MTPYMLMLIVHLHIHKIKFLSCHQLQKYFYNKIFQIYGSYIYMSQIRGSTAMQGRIGGVMGPKFKHIGEIINSLTTYK